MIRPGRQWFGAVAMAVALVPGPVRAQGRAETFDELRRILKAGDHVIVIDMKGAETSGTIAEVSATSLVLTVLVRERGPGGSVTARPDGNVTLTEENVAAILESDAAGIRGSKIYQAPELFVDLRDRLRPGQTAEVTETSGRKIKGKVVATSPTSIVIRTIELGSRSDPRAGTETFVPSAVTRIRRTGTLWDGAVKGAIVGALIPIVFGAFKYEDGAKIVVTIAGMGAGIGVGIDALWGPRTVYRAPRQTRRVTIAPVLEKERQGLMATVTF